MLAYRLITLLVGGLFIWGGGEMRAWAAGGVVISPAFQEVVLGPETSDQRVEITLTNETSSDLTASLSVVDFGSLDESGGIAFLGQETALERQYSLARWLSLEHESVVIPGGEATTIGITVMNQTTLGPGGHYGAVLFRVGGEEVNGAGVPTQIGVNQLFASLFFVRKEGGALPRLEREGWSFPQTWTTVPQTAEIRFHNLGNVHVIPRGVLKVEDIWGRIVARGIVNEESVLVYPETYRKVVVRLRPERRVFFPGRYRVILETRYDGEDEFSTDTKHVDIIPLPVTLLTVALLGALGWVYVTQSRRRKGEREAAQRPAM